MGLSGPLTDCFGLGAQRIFMETNDTKDNYPMNSCNWFCGRLNAQAAPLGQGAPRDADEAGAG